MTQQEAGRKISLRPARREDSQVIHRLVRQARINPLGLKWPRFILAEAGDGSVIGCGQIKEHGDGSRELASIVVEEDWQGQGIARKIIEALLEQAKPPLWLTCRSSLVPLYTKFGFKQVGFDDPQPAYFKRIRGLARVYEMLKASNEYLAVMVWRG